MRKPTPSSDEDESGSYRGFPLKEVTWGYREEFRALLDSLYGKGLLNEQSRPPAEVCGPLLARQARTGYDYVLKELLGALDGAAGWLLRVPDLFRDWRDLGAAFADERVYMGKRYFQLWGEGRFPDSPDEVRRILQWASMLKETDPELAFSFLTGYADVRERLRVAEIPAFIETGLRVFQRSRENALGYFQLKLRSSEAVAERLSRTCRLERVQRRLGRLFRAVAGRPVQIDALSSLDSDDLLECGSGVVCGCGYLYLPERVSTFPQKGLNCSYYVLATMLAAACHRFGSFCTAHGLDGVSRISALYRRLGVQASGLAGFLFGVVELRRLRSALDVRYPGAARMLRKVARAEMQVRGPGTDADRLLAWAAGLDGRGEMSPPVCGVLDWVDALARRCDDHECVLDGLLASWDELPAPLRRPGARFRARPLSFFPDFDFPLAPQAAPVNALVADVSARPKKSAHDAAALAAAARSVERDRSGPEDEQDKDGEDEQSGARPVPLVYLYDEWNGLENEYYRDWCRLQEVSPKPAGTAPPHGEDFRRRVDHVKKLFQRLRPDLVVKDKYLPHGDYINIDSLVRFVALRKARLSPKVQFWVKPRLNRRDVATALLLDVSGSTGREAGRADVIELEKEAAYLLAAGLGELGDEFGLFGFTGNGREQCLFQVFKDFGQRWDDEARSRLAGARPGSSTRIGVALRHAGRKLAALVARTKLTILLTDGRPMDTDYDPRTRYAHHDVRKACEENAALGIHTFCIAVGPEEPEELNIMFPRRRYAVLEDVENLPDVLTRSYLRLTRT